MSPTQIGGGSFKGPTGVPAADTILGSASVDGKWIGISATSSPGTLLHQGEARGQLYDAVTLCVANNDTVVRDLTVVWGTSSPGTGDSMTQTIQPKTGFRLVLDRFRLLRTRPLYAYASVANVLTAYVEVTGI